MNSLDVHAYADQASPQSARYTSVLYSSNRSASSGALFGRPTPARYAALMDSLWTPWRYKYVSRAEKHLRKGVPAALDAWQGDLSCVFCNMIAAVDFAVASGIAAEAAELAAHIVHRGTSCFLVLNAFPYSTGHVMVVPYAHTDSLAALEPAVAVEMIQLAQQVERTLRQVYRPDGLNFGLNLGEAAGAGVANHIHLHGLPRWSGDTNFMTVVSETRVLPETLDITWGKLRQAFASLTPSSADTAFNPVAPS